MIRTMASPGQESESLNSQFLVDSMPAMIHTARPDGYLDNFNKRWLEYLGVIRHDVFQWKCRVFVHREVEGIVAKGRACLATEKNSDTKLGSAGRMGNTAGSSIARCHSATGAATASTSKILVDRLRANDRTRAVTNCDPARSGKFDSLWRDR
jgi:hypothetical protein